MARARARDRAGRKRTGLYAEQPYTRRTGVDPGVPPWIAEHLVHATFTPVAAGPRDRAAKWRRSAATARTPLLGMHRSLRVARSPLLSLPVGRLGRGLTSSPA